MFGWIVRVLLYDGSTVVVPVADWGTGCLAVNEARKHFPGQIARGEVEWHGA